MIATVVEVDPQFAVIMNGITSDRHPVFQGTDENTILLDPGNVVAGDKRAERTTRRQVG